jgi:hypothetical protein
MKRNILLWIAIFVILLGLVNKSKAQHTYDPTNIMIDIVGYGGGFLFDMDDVSVDPGITTQLGVRFRDTNTELYIEILGGYNSLNLKTNMGNDKEYYNNIDFNIGVFLSKIYSLKIGGFFLYENSNTVNNTFGVMFSGQVDYPLTKKLNLVINGTLGGNLKSESTFNTLLKGVVGISYNLNSKLY